MELKRQDVNSHMCTETLFSNAGGEERLLQNTRGKADSNQKGDFKGQKSDQINRPTKLTGLQAYKKLAMQWHPDKFQDEEDKKKAEKKFMDIAAAKEVLADEGQFKHIVYTFWVTLWLS